MKYKGTPATCPKCGLKGRWIDYERWAYNLPENHPKERNFKKRTMYFRHLKGQSCKAGRKPVLEYTLDSIMED